jgi:hypothetical protein
MGPITAVLGAYLLIGVCLSLIGPIHRELAGFTRASAWNMYGQGIPTWKIRAVTTLTYLACVFVWPILIGERFRDWRRREPERKDASTLSASDWPGSVDTPIPPDTVLQIGNCPFSFVCSKKWSELREDSASHNVRFCMDCKKSVFLCETESEFNQHSRAGHCVAVNVNTSDEDEDSVHEIMGLPNE